jgi:hypothetical protein
MSSKDIYQFINSVGIRLIIKLCYVGDDQWNTFDCLKFVFKIQLSNVLIFLAHVGTFFLFNHHFGRI